MLTVKELIESLKEMPDGAEVWVITESGVYRPVIDVEAEATNMVSIGIDCENNYGI